MALFLWLLVALLSRVGGGDLSKIFNPIQMSKVGDKSPEKSLIEMQVLHTAPLHWVTLTMVMIIITLRRLWPPLRGSHGLSAIGTKDEVKQAQRATNLKSGPGGPQDFKLVYNK